MLARQEVHESLLEHLGKAVDHLVGVRRHERHLSLMALGSAVALEAVLVAALLLTHLAVPPQLLQALGLHAVRDRLRVQEAILGHLVGSPLRAHGPGGKQLCLRFTRVQGPPQPIANRAGQLPIVALKISQQHVPPRTVVIV